jgi:hypothetical protein
MFKLVALSLLVGTVLATNLRILAAAPPNTNAVNCSNAAIDCNNHGTCNLQAPFNCVCDDQHVGTDCSYERPKMWKDLLSAWLGSEFGMHYFYLGFIGLGIGQLLLFWLSCCFGCGGICYNACSSTGNETTKTGHTAVGCIFITLQILCILAWIGWTIATIVFAFQGTADINGVQTV